MPSEREILCEWRPADGGVQCPRCKTIKPLPTTRRCRRRCAPHIVNRVTKNPLPLGDYTERLLASVGVTPERYVEAKKLFGLAPTCGCSKRKEWMNRVGAWLAGGKA